MHNEEKKSIRNKVLEEIQSGRAMMRPRWHFVLKTTLVVVGGVILSLFIIYIASFVVFVLHQNGAWFAPSFGFTGLGILFQSIPWVMVLLVIVFGVLLEVLVKKYSFAYRTPLLYSAGGVLFLVFLGIFLIPYLGVHRGVMRYTFDHDVPLARPLYEAYSMQGPGTIHPGTVTRIGEGEFEITDRFGDTARVFITSSTDFPLEKEFLEGDKIVIFGDRDDEGINAFGMRKVDEEWERGPRMRMDLPPVKY